MHERSLAVLIAFALLAVLCCTRTSVERIVSGEGAIIELNGARLEIPSGSVPASVKIRIEKKGVARRSYAQGFTVLGESYSIQPESLVFLKPVLFSCPVKGERSSLGAKVGNGFVPLASAQTVGDTLVARLWHGGEYLLIIDTEQYGIVEHTKTNEGLLIVGDIYVGDYIDNFEKAMRESGYELPFWTFRYDHRQGIEDNARLLQEELKRLHGEYGEFRMDVVSFGIGGLVTHRYLTDTSYYQRDISSAVIAIGTPFFGSNFAAMENVLKGKGYARFFFVDAMGENAFALMPGSEFIARVQDKRHLPGYHYYDDPTENKNFVSLHGHVVGNGMLPEELSGDGLVSVRSAMLTAIEPAAFELTHLDLLESEVVHKVAADFVRLYRSYNWPMLFSSVWNGRESYAKINDTWEREVKLHFRDDADFAALIEYNKNMLFSTPANAVLITNGDYDTYPAWLLQGDGLRPDVLIVNRSLLNLKDYARFLVQQGLPLGLSEQELEQLKHIMADGRFMSISEQLIQRLLKQTSRPVVLSTTLYEPKQYGYPLRLSGLVYEIGEPDIDVGRTKHLLYEVFEYGKLLARPLDSLDINIKNMAKNYAAVAFSLASALEKPEQYGEAIEAIKFARQFAEEPVFYYTEAQIYFRRGERESADSILKRLLDIETGDSKLKKDVAQIYYENGMKENAVKVLADLLREHPADREIVDLIRKYQED
jgi:tetratricopeptide (TPR) repeat protein